MRQKEGFFGYEIRYTSLFPGNYSREYDPETGDYREDTIQETKRLASVMNTGEETLKLLYGSIKQGSLTIQLQNHYNAPFSRIRIGETIYQADVSRKLRVKHTFIVSEVQGCQSKDCRRGKTAKED